MKRCELYYSTLQQFCVANEVSPIMAVARHLFYYKNNKYYVAHYHKLENRYNIHKSKEIKLCEMYSLIITLLEQEGLK